MINVDFKSGKVIYNEYHVDFSKPFSGQLDELNEDILQVKYGSDYLLDMGWYPEHEENGTFIVQVVKKNDWKRPVYKHSCTSQSGLVRSLIKAIEIADKNCEW